MIEQPVYTYYCADCVGAYDTHPFRCGCGCVAFEKEEVNQ